MSAKSKSKASKMQSTQQSPLFILHYKTRRVLVGSPKDYDQLQLSIRRHFPDIPAGHRVSYHTNELDISKGALVEISEDIWDTAIPLLSALTVQTEPQASPWRSAANRPSGAKPRKCDSSSDESDDTMPSAKKLHRVTLPPSQPPRAPPPTREEHGNLTLKIATLDDRRVEIRCTTSTTVNSILSRAVEHLGLDKDVIYRAIYEGQIIGSSDSPSREWDSLTIEKFGIQDGDHIHIIPRLTGGKPVIYLFAPAGAEIDASVKLSLAPEWHFSAIYPVVPITSCGSESDSGEQTLQWDVKASSDGMLLEKNTGLEVAYLFWEAETLAIPTKELTSPSLPGSSLPIDHDGESVEARFIPTLARIEPSNSVVLEVAKLTPYLDSMLKALGLHVEARTSFITYWLPSFLKHTHIALRFLPQQAYEHAAPLEVLPKPDVTVRVFMLFKGLKLDDVQNQRSAWREANDNNDAGRWKSTVGVDGSCSLADGTLFRVVEWGGMEVLS